MTASLDSDAATEALAGPQPLGAFDLPAGMLLVPTRTPEEDSVRRDLLAGRLPSSWPASLEGHRLAHQGDLAAAAAAFTGDDPTDQYNRWVLDADTSTADEVRAGLPAHLHPLVDVVAWSVGASDDLPVDDPALPDEVRALVVATRASELMSTGRDVEARGLLQQAATLVTATNPVLAAVLLGNAAGLGLDHDADLTAARADLESALVDLTDTDLRTMRAELLNQRARSPTRTLPGRVLPLLGRDGALLRRAGAGDRGVGPVPVGQHPDQPRDRPPGIADDEGLRPAAAGGGDAVAARLPAGLHAAGPPGPVVDGDPQPRERARLHPVDPPGRQPGRGRGALRGGARVRCARP